MPNLPPALLALALSAVALVSPASAAEPFLFENYFVGKTYADGKFSAINGVSRSFKVELTGTWNGKRLKLVEDFVYSDGERDRKTWRFTKTGPNTYSGTREDVIGEVPVKISGNVARFSYDVYLDGAAKKNKVRFHDTMVLNKDGTVLNTAWVTKFGLPVAKTRVSFRR